MSLFCNALTYLISSRSFWRTRQQCVCARARNNFLQPFVLVRCCLWIPGRTNIPALFFARNILLSDFFMVNTLYISFHLSKVVLYGCWFVTKVNFFSYFLGMQPFTVWVLNGGHPTKHLFRESNINQNSRIMAASRVRWVPIAPAISKSYLDKL